MITGEFYPAPHVFPAGSFCHKLDMDSNSWNISSPLIQTKDQSNSEYAHMAPGTKQDIFILLGNSRVSTLPYPWAPGITRSEW